jgi:hypothetical protein
MPSFDTGQWSLVLNILIVVIGLSGFFFIYALMRRKTLEQTQLDKLIEIGKWMILSLAVTSIVSIVADGFKERTQDLAELNYFDKYSTIITKHEAVEEQYLLSEYFAAVSPSGSMRDSWTRYKDILQPKYDSMLVLNQRSKPFDAKILNGDTLTPREQKEYNKINIEKKMINDQLAKTGENQKLSFGVYSIENSKDALTQESIQKAKEVTLLLQQQFPDYTISNSKISVDQNNELKIQQNQIRYTTSETEEATKVRDVINGSNILSNEKVILVKDDTKTKNGLAIYIRNM